MGKQHSDFTPLDPQRAQELEMIIDEAARRKEAVVIDPDVGVAGSTPANLVSPMANALVRYGKHYG